MIASSTSCITLLLLFDMKYKSNKNINIINTNYITSIKW